MKRARGSLVGWLVAPLVLLSACSDGDSPLAVTEPVPTTLELDRSELELVPGETVTVVATVSSQTGAPMPGSQILWESLDASVAAVDAQGIVVGQGVGVTAVVATVQSLSDTVSVTVASEGVAEDVFVADSSSYRLVSDSAQVAAGILRFETADGAPTPEVGDILVGDEGGGFLRRVTEVRRVGDVVEFTTAPAAMAEAIKAGQFEVSAVLTPDGPQQVGGVGDVVLGSTELVYLANGVSTTSTGLELNLRIEREVCHGGSACADLAVTQRGALTFTPTVTAGVEFGFFQINRIYTSAEGALDLSLDFHALATGTVGYEEEVLLAEYSTPFAAVVAGVPVKGRFVMRLHSGVSVDMHAEAEMTAATSAYAGLEVGAEYRRDNPSGWEPIFTPSLGYSPPTMEWDAWGDAELVGWVRPEIEVVFYESVSPRLGFKPYLVADGKIDLDAWDFRLTGAMDTQVGVNVAILSYELADFEWLFAGNVNEIGRWNGDFARTLTVSKSGAGTVTSEPSGIEIGSAETSGSASFPRNSTVTLSAVPASGWKIGSWDGACGGAGSTCEVVMDQARAVSIAFEVDDEGDPLVITTSALPGGTVGQSYSATLQASGGRPPYFFSVTAGVLPNGLTIEASTGHISGTPTQAGTWAINFQVTDVNGRTQIQQLSITISPTVSGQYILNDDFESYGVGTFPSSGGWFIRFNGAGNSEQYISDRHAFSGSRSFRLHGRNGWDARILRELPIVGAVMGFEASFLVESASYGGHVALRNPQEGTWGRSVIGVNFRDGSIFLDGSEIGSYDVGFWKTVRVVADRLRGRVSVWIDDQLVLHDVDHSYPDFEVTHLSLTARNVGTNIVFFDGVKVWLQP